MQLFVCNEIVSLGAIFDSAVWWPTFAIVKFRKKLTLTQFKKYISKKNKKRDYLKKKTKFKKVSIKRKKIPSFSSKRGHVTVKHVLTGRKHDKLGNQTFEVLQPLKRTVHTIPLTYFTYWSSSCHLNYFISEILAQNTWFEVSAVFVYQKHRKLSNFGAKVCLTAVELQMFG